MDAQQAPWERPIESGMMNMAERVDDTQSFDPTQYLTDIRGAAYLEVKYRLMWLEATCPYFNIYTREVQITPEIAIFSATVSIYPTDAATANSDGDPEWNRVATRTATAHGSETPADFGDYIEKAETKAIGRALAMLGFGTQFAAEFTSEISAAPRERPVDAPVRPNVQRSTPTGPANPMRQWQGGGNSNSRGSWTTSGSTLGRGQMQNPDGPPTPKQRGYAQGLAEEIFGEAWTDEINRLLEQEFSPAGNEWGTMTKDEASKLIEHLKGMKQA